MSVVDGAVWVQMRPVGPVTPQEWRAWLLVHVLWGDVGPATASEGVSEPLGRPGGPGAAKEYPIS